MPEELTKTLFSAHLGSKFQVVGRTGEQVELDLVECREGKSQPNYEFFALLFKGPRHPVFPQRTFDVQHPALGKFQVFLVPVSQDADSTYYESVFNRLINKPAV